MQNRDAQQQKELSKKLITRDRDMLWWVDQLRATKRKKTESPFLFFSIALFLDVLIFVRGGEILDDLESDCFGRANQDSTFEIHTGVLLTAPSSLLETLPGIASLSQCISACESTRSCRALNYETELCVLFSTSATYEPDALSQSQFPVFTIYAQKICVRSSRSFCASSPTPWVFDIVMNHKLMGPEKLHRITLTREECMGLCISSSKFICRSVNFDVSSGSCSLLDVDRRSGVLKQNNGFEYIESKCISEPQLSLCKFKSIEDRMLKTMDSVHYKVKSLNDCKSLCIQKRCLSYDYKESGPEVCRLSFQSSLTLSHISSPYIDILGATTYELGACYNISVDCRDSYMIAKVRTNQMFKGKIYGMKRPNSCGLHIENQFNFSLQMEYNDIGCDVKEVQPGHFVSDVVLQHHSTIVTNSDISLKVRCNYDLLNRTVNNQDTFNVDGELGETAEAEQTIIHSPNVSMRITDRQRRDVTAAKVGDHLALTFRIETNEMKNHYEIFVRELVAIDGLDSSEIILIDELGCPMDVSIMSHVKQVNGSAQTLQADFDAFKFPTSDTVQFRALVTPCIPRCDPIVCNLGYPMYSYGKRRRRRETVEGSTPENEVLVGGKIIISDRFESNEEKSEESTQLLGRQPYRCLDAFGATIGGGAFLFTQMIFVAGILYFHVKRKGYSSRRDDGFANHPIRR
ncbi:unnamed protein product [Lepeophtheirus salmonis]|uniref:(salmon louse) hypothetical protein n=1 Tax=Lepeophtheirus salmonis TaxID=72036 RepID=A0A7R8CQM4_LEPSM|nr:unnamed protein product [Lepeophtheirus salmonis]CAF2896364.1 unnamed protein product [Lepeophtheirus salmonis]